MIRIRRVFTRDEIEAALEAADRPDLADGIHSRLLSRATDDAALGQTALAFRIERDADLAVFSAVVGLAMPFDEYLEFAASTRRTDTGLVAYWPGWVLDEPSTEQAADAAMVGTV